MIMSYMNDPREMAIRPESGYTLEEDNRIETMYHWGAMVLDLCDLPISEYMKPTTVIVSGIVPSDSGNTSGKTSGSTSSLTQETINIYASLYKNGSAVTDDESVKTAEESTSSDSESKESEKLNIEETTLNTELYSPNPSILGASSTDEWKVVWQWTGEFEGSIKSTVVLTISGSDRFVTVELSDNTDKKYEKKVELNEGEEISKFSTYGIGAVSSDEEDINGVHVYSAMNASKSVEYTFNISNNVDNIKLSFNRVLSGTIVETKTYFYKDVIATYTGSTDKEGYEFDGWFYSDGTSFVEGTTMPAKSLTIYGKYHAKTFTATFYKDDIIVKEISGITYGSKIKASLIPTSTTMAKKGYGFIGWEPSPYSAITEDKAFIGQYSAINYTLRWYFASGASASTVLHYGDTIDYDSALESAQTPGLTFVSWNYSGETMPASNLSISANYTLTYYTYKFIIEQEDGTQNVYASGSTAHGGKIGPVKVPIIDGYTLTDWSGYTSGMTMGYNDLEFISYQTANIYTLGYYIGYTEPGDYVNVDWKDYSAVTYAYTKEVTPMPEYEQEGYTVTSWIGEPGAGMPSYNCSGICYAFINSYDVAFYDESGNVISVESAKYQSSISALTPTIEGCTYHINEGNPELVPAYNVNISGTVVPNNYIVTINGIPYSLPYHTNIDDYMNEHYEDKEGYTKEYTTDPENTEYVPANDDLKITLTYSPIGYIVDVNGTDMTIYYGENILSAISGVEVIVEEGKELKGWQDQDGNKIEDDTTMGLGDITRLTPIFEVIMTHVKVIVDGTLQSEQDYAYGTTYAEIIDKAELDERADDIGYNCVWSVNGVELTSLYETVKDVDLIFEWTATANSYILSFYNTNILISSAETEYKSSVVYPTVEDKTIEGVEYIFKWSGETITEMPSHDVNIIGEYIAKPTAPIYYGAIINPSTATSATIEGLNSVSTADTEAGANITITIPMSEEYTEKYNAYKGKSITYSEFNTWKKSYTASSAYTLCIYVPKDVIDGGKTFEWLDAINSAVAYDNILPNVTVNGTEYIPYTFDDSSLWGGIEDTSYDYKITLK